MTFVLKSKALSDAAWKDVLAKNKTLKDNGLLRSLADVRKLGEEDHDQAEAKLDEIAKLTTQLKKSKEASANPAVLKILGEMSSAADAALKDVAKAKAEAEKKAKLAVAKDEKAKDKGEEGQEEGEEETPALLTTKMIPLLRQVNKGETMQVLVARAGKQVAVLMSRKPISPSKRKLLAGQLGNVGGIKYFGGHCTGEEGTTTFVLKSEVSGLAKQLKLALLNQTGLRVRKLACRGEDGQTDEHEDAEGEHGGHDTSPGAASSSGSSTAAPRTSVQAAVGRGGKNDPEDVRYVQEALNRRADAGLKVDGRCDNDTLAAIVRFQEALGQSKPDGRVDPGRGTARALSASGKVGKPPPKPSPKAPPQDLGEPVLARAPQVWHGTRSILDHNIGELKRAIRQEYANEHPKLLSEIDQNVQRVDVVLEKLDTRLATTLERANAATTPASRKKELDAAKGILTDYVAFVKKEPLIDHIDKNPFGVDAQVRKTITDSLTHMIKSIA